MFSGVREREHWEQMGQISISEAEECLSYWVRELGGEDILNRWVENFIETIVSVVIPPIA